VNFFFAVGLMTVLVGVWVLYRVRTRAGLLFGLSAQAACPAFTFWSRPNCVLFDSLTRMPGLGLLCGYIGGNLVIVLQVAWALTVLKRRSQQYQGRYQAGMTLCGVLLVLAVITWSVAQREVGHDAARLFYHGYRGWPTGVLLWNMITGLSTVYASVFSLHLVRRLWRYTHEIKWAVIACANCVTIIYGCSIALQAVLDRAGVGVSVRPVEWSMVAATFSAIVVAAACWMIFVTPRWRQPFRLLSLLMRVKRLYPVRRDLVALLSLLSDRLVALRSHTDDTLVRDVTDRCAADGVPHHWRRIAIEAARWITVRRALIARQPWSQVDAVKARATDEAIVANAVRHVKGGTYLYADLCYVVILALGLELVPTWLESLPEPLAWHRAVALLISDALTARRGMAPSNRELGGGVARPAWGEGVRRGRYGWASLAWRDEGRRTWRAIGRYLSPRAVETAIAYVYDDLVTLSMLCTDWMAYIEDCADATVVHAVAKLCETADLPIDQRLVALEATRWMTFFLPAATDRANPAAGPIDAGAQAPALTPIGSLDLAHEPIHYANVCRVLVLLLSPSRLPLGVMPRRKLTGWHRNVAALITVAIAPQTSIPC